MASGLVLPFAGGTAPDGWLLCHGQAVSRTEYPALFAAIGTTYGAGDGSTTFNVPDARGEFIRGLDAGRGVDAGRQLGSAQADQFRSHTHEFLRTDTSTAGQAAVKSGGGEGTSTYQTTETRGGNETRPRNIALNYLIKT